MIPHALSVNHIVSILSSFRKRSFEIPLRYLQSEANPSQCVTFLCGMRGGIWFGGARTHGQRESLREKEKSPLAQQSNPGGRSHLYIFLGGLLARAALLLVAVGCGTCRCYWPGWCRVPACFRVAGVRSCALSIAGHHRSKILGRGAGRRHETIILRFILADVSFLLIGHVYFPSCSGAGGGEGGVTGARTATGAGGGT